MRVWKLSFSKLPFYAAVYIKPGILLFPLRYSSTSSFSVNSCFSRSLVKLFSRSRLKAMSQSSQQGEAIAETPAPITNGVEEKKREVVDNDKKEKEFPDKYRIRDDLRLVWIDCEVSAARLT